MTPASRCFTANIHLITTERTQNHNLPESYEPLLGRLKIQMKCFEKYRHLLQRYDEIIKGQLSKAVIENIYHNTLLLHWNKVLPNPGSCTTRLQKQKL